MEGADDGFPAMPAARTTIVAASAAPASSAPRQPSEAIAICMAGTSRNWPTEPPAVTMPKARPRFSAGTKRPTAPSTTTKVTPVMARPRRVPSVIWSPKAPATCEARTRLSA